MYATVSVDKYQVRCEKMEKIWCIYNVCKYMYIWVYKYKCRTDLGNTKWDLTFKSNSSSQSPGVYNKVSNSDFGIPHPSEVAPVLNFHHTSIYLWNDGSTSLPVKYFTYHSTIAKSHFKFQAEFYCDCRLNLILHPFQVVSTTPCQLRCERKFRPPSPHQLK